MKNCLTTKLEHPEAYLAFEIDHKPQFESGSQGHSVLVDSVKPYLRPIAKAGHNASIEWYASKS